MSHDDGSSIARGFLFADLRGYTTFVERHGDRAGVELLTAYRDVVRRVVPRFSGAEIRTEGDSFYVVFNSPSAALNCGLAILEEAGRTTTTGGDAIKVGIGVHAGETFALDDAYVGSAVNIAARICSIARPGQLLTSEAVRSLTHSFIDAAFVPVGRRRLKGISDPIVVYRVLASADMAAPRSGASWRGSSLRVGALVALLVAVLGSSVVIATLMREGFGAITPRPTATTEVPTTAVGGTDAAPDETPTATAEPGFPTSAEQRLLALVEDRFQPSCERAPERERPTFTHLEGDGALVPGGELEFGTQVFVAPVTAEITCSPFGGDAPDELTLWEVSSPALPVRDLILNIAGSRGVPIGSCEDALPAHQAWSAGPVSGRRVCLADPAAIYWTYDGADVLGRATRSDGDIAALLAWWEAEARLRRPS